MGPLATIHAAFHEPETRIYKVVNTTVWVLIVSSVVLLGLEPFLLDQPSQVVEWLVIVDETLLAIFAVEVSLRILSYRPPDLDVFSRPPLGALRTHVVARAKYAMQPMNVVDIITVLSFVPALRSLRALRLLRLLRTIKLFRYSNPFEGVILAIERDRLLFTLAFGVLLTEVVIGGTSIYLVERIENPGINSLGDGIWWALVTITTVGFGDITAVTPLGRVVAGVLMVGGMFMLAFFAGIVGHSLLNTVLSVREEQFRMSGYVNHIVVCGFADDSSLLLSGLIDELDLDKTKVLLFANRPRPNSLPPQFMWVEGDPSKESELDKGRLSHARAVILVADHQEHGSQADAMTILTAFTIRSYMAKQKSAPDRKVPLYIIAEILDPENVEHARTAGIDEVVQTTRVGFDLITHAVTNPGTGRMIARIALHSEANIYVGQLPADLELPTAYADVAAHIRKTTGALVIGYRESLEEASRINPEDDAEVPAGALVVYLSEGPVLKSAT